MFENSYCVKYCKSFLLVAALLLSTTAMTYGQPGGDNRCIVHLDKSFYVNGEVIWYKLYLPATFRDQHPAIKVKLLDAEGNTEYYHFLKTGGTLCAQGYIKIPFDFPTGMYHLVFVANEQPANQPVILAQAPAPVYNDDPRTPPPAGEGASFAETAQTTTLSGELQVTVSIEQEQVSRRDSIRATVSVRDAAGRPVRAGLSVAVTDWELTNRKVHNRPTIKTGKVIAPETASQLDTALYTRVKVMDGAGNLLQANVLGVYSPKDNQWEYTTSSSQGLSYVALQDFSGKKPIQLLGYYKETEDIRVELLDEQIEVTEAPLLFNEHIGEYLELSRRRKKIYQHRSALEFELEPELPAAKQAPPEADVTLQVQDYESFDNLAVFFREITTSLRFRLRDDSTYYAEMANPDARFDHFFYPGDPLFIIDGKATRNADFIARMPPDQIQEIGLFFRRPTMRRYFNVFGNSGVIVITTTIPNIELPQNEAQNILSVAGRQPGVSFPVFHPQQIDQDPHLALFRPQLYWNPGLEADDDGQATFSFHQSDDRSTFRMEVVAQSPDGQVGRGVLEYEVR